MHSSFFLLSSSNSLFSSPYLSTTQRFTSPSRNHHFNSFLISPFSSQLHFNSLLGHHHTPSAVSTIISAPGASETSQIESKFVEVGYIYSVHGLHGEVRVKCNTDFPELRFSEPGTRWLKQEISGINTIQEIELIEGRGHPGQKSWIVRFNEIDTIEEARKLVGSTMLVKDENRPDLEEGEFYTRDLVGMKVILKETGETIGNVINVYASGASDLLQVKLDLSSGPLIWVPFVESIVPEVNMFKREMLITPPKGLLELNIRANERSKKDRRQIEWKERKKFQKQLIASKKKLIELKQQHIFNGFQSGEKEQGKILANHIIGVNTKLFQQALQNIEIPVKRWDFREFLNGVKSKNKLKVSESGKQYLKIQEKGQVFYTSGKVAHVLVFNDASSLVEDLINDATNFLKIEDRSSVPLISVCPAHSISVLEESFLKHDYYAFDPEKVWFVEEEKLPIVSNSVEEQNKYKILMKSPWEILDKSVGSGGIITRFSSLNLLDNLSELGVQFIQVCSVDKEFRHGDTLLGLMDSCEAQVGVRMFDFDERFQMIFSIGFLKKVTKQVEKLKFEVVTKMNLYVEKVDKEWVDVVPCCDNSYEFGCSIYSCLELCSQSKVCVLEVME